jgi:hypothetical protein
MYGPGVTTGHVLLHRPNDPAEPPVATWSNIQRQHARLDIITDPINSASYMGLKEKERRVIKLAINRTVHCVLAVVDEEMVGLIFRRARSGPWRPCSLHARPELRSREYRSVCAKRRLKLEVQSDQMNSSADTEICDDHTTNPATVSYPRTTSAEFPSPRNQPDL